MIKYRVRVLHNSGYTDIQDSIGKEFDAVNVAGMYYIEAKEFNSSVPENTYLVFDADAIEVIEIATEHTDER